VSVTVSVTVSGNSTKIPEKGQYCVTKFRLGIKKETEQCLIFYLKLQSDRKT
jgi:hypothetical protein